MSPSPINLEGIGKVQPKDKKRRPKHKRAGKMEVIKMLRMIGTTAATSQVVLEGVQRANEVYDVAKYWDNLLTGEFAGFELQRPEAKATDGELGNYKGGYRQVCTEDRKES